jgi:hypothetical protein
MDIIGKKYNKLTCIKKDENKDKRYYIFRCDCGKEKSIIASNVKSGLSTSCGCVKLKGNNTKHGGKGTRLYNIWKSMRERCNNPNTTNHSIYYDRGIKVCPDWNDFSVFKNWALSNGYEENLTIDRIDGNKGYMPSNCRWATYLEQNNNTRNVKTITINGKAQSYSTWERELGFSRGLISSRIKKGWSIEKTLTTPVRHINN